MDLEKARTQRHWDRCTLDPDHEGACRRVAPSEATEPPEKTGTVAGLAAIVSGPDPEGPEKD